MLSGCGSTDVPPSPVREKFSGVIYDAFDTTTTVIAYCETQEEFNALLKGINSELMRYHELYDIYNSYSGITNLCDVNRSAASAPLTVPEEITDILLFAKEMYAQVGGKMNIAMGSVLKIWHDAREYNNNFSLDPVIPSEEELIAAAQHCVIDDIVIDEAAHTVYLADPEMRIDVGAVAKGYAVERIATALEAEGRDSICISAGGNVRTIGSKPGGEPWVIGVANPDTLSPEKYIDKVSVSGEAVVTSGAYQRYFTFDGRRYHHIIDPETLFPEQRYQSVTIIAGSSAVADALSTAVFNMDFEAGKQFVDGQQTVAAMWILQDGTIEYSAKFPEYQDKKPGSGA